MDVGVEFLAGWCCLAFERIQIKVLRTVDTLLTIEEGLLDGTPNIMGIIQIRNVLPLMFIIFLRNPVIGL
jgi:hypothetical protein